MRFASGLRAKSSGIMVFLYGKVIFSPSSGQGGVLQEVLDCLQRRMRIALIRGQLMGFEQGLKKGGRGTMCGMCANKTEHRSFFLYRIACGEVCEQGNLR